MLGIDPGVEPDAGRAVGRKGVVKLGTGPQCINFIHILEEHSSDVLKRSLQSIYVDIFRRVVAIVGPQPYDVAFVGNHVVKLILSEEALGSGIALSLLLARLNGNRK